MKQEQTLLSMLARRWERDPEGEVCRFVSRNGDLRKVSVQELLSRATAFAATYGRASSARKAIGVCLYSGLDLHAAFIGALWSGHIPTMLAPPSPRMEAAKYTDSFARLLQHIQPAHLVVDREVLQKLDLGALRTLSDTVLLNPAEVQNSDWVAPAKANPDDVAVLQHSSGTTGLQKGVALSHRAILEHNRAYSQRLGLSSNDRIVSWLPLYHDMGFVACFLLPLLQGIPFVELSPLDWVLRPVSLLEQISRERGTICWLPNFAFAYMAESIRPSELATDLDLSAMRAWVNCSEPVSHASYAAFHDRFKDFGVRWDQFTASYAMAENVFAVSQSLPGDYRTLSINRERFSRDQRIELDASANGLPVVSNGRLIEGTEIAVLDEQRERLEDNQVGELAIRGAWRFNGYFDREDLTRAALTSDGWYLTGDLGFVRDGEVYVTGRKKDLIIIQGRNIYPGDVEQIVSEIPGLIPGRAVAFDIRGEAEGTDRLVILAEAIEYAGPQAKALALLIRNAVAQELNCTPYDVRIVPPRWLIKSTAGKMARNDNRTKYLETIVLKDQRSPVYV